MIIRGIKDTLCDLQVFGFGKATCLITREAGSSWLMMSLTFANQKTTSITRQTLESAMAVARETEAVASTAAGASTRFLAAVEIRSPEGKCAQLHL